MMTFPHRPRIFTASSTISIFSLFTKNIRGEKSTRLNDDVQKFSHFAFGATKVMGLLKGLLYNADCTVL